MRDKFLISFLIITHNRRDDLRRAVDAILEQNYRPIEIIIVDNNSTDGTEHAVKAGYNESFVKYVKLAENKGVAGARNVAIRKASGDIAITVDDDAVILGKDSIQKVVDKFKSDEKIGALAFKIINYDSRQILPREFPHRDKTLDPDKEFETTYFIGAGHAVRKQVYDRAGLYMDSFYGMEELDLSYRILDAAYRIIYFPQVQVLHKRTGKGRVANEWEHMIQNRIKMLYRNLPWRYAIVNAIFWIWVALIKTKSVLVIFRALGSFLREFEGIRHQRKVLSPEAIKRIKKLKGRLYF
ncbi:MAG: glycosyltransferase family 2 protein [Planctomycetota bacterium]|jgi:GT2 family glycosyltransferase